MQRFVCTLTTLLAILTTPSLQAANNYTLSAGERQQGEISGCQADAKTQKRVCETHSWQVELPAGKYWRVEVEQLGIDLVLSVLPPGAQQSIEVNTPAGRVGMESVLVHSASGGSYELQVSSTEHPEARGRYEISVHELGSRTAAEQRRLKAEKTLTEAAGVFLQQPNPAAAIPLYENALQLWRELEDSPEEAWAAYYTGLLYAEVDDAQKARSYFMHAGKLFEQAGDLIARGYLLNDLGLTLSQLGDQEQAEQRFQQARALGRELEDPYLEANAINNLGLILHYGGDLSNAKRYYEKALQLFKQHDELEEQANTLNNIAGIYFVLGEPDPAFDHFGEALSLSRLVGDKEREIAALGNIATLHRVTGDLKQALTLYLQILETARATGNLREEAWSLSRISRAYYALGEYQRAWAFAQEVLPLWRKFNDKKGEASALTDIGKILFSLGKTRQALDAFAKAIALHKSSESAVGEADALIAAGRAHLALDDTKMAAQAFDEAFAILSDVGDKRGQATALQWRGSVYIADGASAQALNILERALTLHHGSHNQAGEAETLYQIAVAEKTRSAYREAQKHLDAAMTIIESMRANISNPDLRSTFFGVKQHVYELNIDNLMALHRVEPGKAHEQSALEASERARARTLLDLLNEAGADIQQSVGPELRARQSALLREINAKTEKQQGLLSREHSSAAARALEFELQAKLSELDSLESQIRTRHPGYAALAQPKALNIAEIQSLLDPDTLLLEYALGEKRSFVWAVTNNVVHSAVLPPRKEIETAARQLYARISRLDPQAWREQQKSRAVLAQILLQPVAKYLSKQRIVIVANGVLHYVPFGALLLPDSGAKSSNLSRDAELVQNYEILYLPSATALAASRAQRANRRKASKLLAVLGDPVFELSDPRLQNIQSSAAFVPAAEGSNRQATSQELQRLVFSRAEATAIANLVPPQERLLALDFEASRATAMSEQISQFRIVHFATHGMLNSQNPELSGLTLSRYDKAGHRQPGFLGLHDVYNLELAADLVVLSGCETGLGRQIRGEGLVGLTRGFMYAGAPTVVASLWRVSDKVTAELMRKFYRAMFDNGLQPAAALRAAQLSIKNNPEQRSWRDPYYWAGFILQGDWQ